MPYALVVPYSTWPVAGLFIVQVTTAAVWVMPETPMWPIVGRVAPLPFPTWTSTWTTDGRRMSEDIATVPFTTPRALGRPARRWRHGRHRRRPRGSAGDRGSGP